MKPASITEDAATSKKVLPKSRRKSSEDPGKNSSSSQSKTSSHRKSSDGRDTSTRRDLSEISKPPNRRGSKTAAGDENASAFSSGSGGSSQKKSLVRKGTTGSRSRSPTQEGHGDDINPPAGFRKKSSVTSRRKSGETVTSIKSQQHSSFAPDATMWEPPSFFGSSAKGSDDPSSQPDFASPACDGGVDDGAFNSGSFSGFGDDSANTKNRQGTKVSPFADFDPSAFTQDSGENAPTFGSAPRDTMDMTPLKDPPRRKVGKLSLVKQGAFSQYFACQPVKNPANGNIIFCTSRDGEMFIQEVDPSRSFAQVMSSPILTPDLHRRVTAKYSRSAYGIDNVLRLCVGMHQSHGQPKIRIVAVVDLLVLDSKHILRAIAVWQWGYGSHEPVSLQFLLSPPSGTDYAYDPESILATDNLVFIAGASAKGPCVFMCKPSVRESWSANFLGPSGRITSMAVIANPKRKHPYLAVGMADGNVSVWTYSVALKQAASKKNEPFRRLLYPLCRLDALWVIKGLQPTYFGEDNKKQKPDDKEDAGICKSLEWLPQQPAMSSLLLLCAGFQGGFAVFHVALPLVADGASGKFVAVASPLQSTHLSSTPQIRPFVAVRFPVQQQDLFASWVDFGPHNNPCLALLMHRKGSDDEPGRVVLGAINMTEYRKGTKQKEVLAAFRMVATTVWRSKTKAFPTGLLSSKFPGAVLIHNGQGISTLYPSHSNNWDDPAILSLKHPIFSNPPGVDSTGEVTGSDTTNDKEGVLHVFSAFQCDRVEVDQQPNMLFWSRPARRYWLIRTVCGDRKETQVHEEANQFDVNDAIALGGGVSSVVCELEVKSLAGLTPGRIVRCRGSPVVAILFRPSLGHSSQGVSLSMDCVSIALVSEPKSGPVNVEVVEGRDIMFLPSQDATIKALVLSRDGSAVSCYQQGSSGWSKGSTFRPILGVEADDTYVEGHRLFLLSSNDKFGIAVVGKRYADDRSCILCGRSAGVDQISGDRWKGLLPDLSPGEPCVWLQDGEDILSLVCLPSKHHISPKIAVATSRRVLILSMSLAILAASRTMLTSGAMAPLGSSTVAFTERTQIRYLCPLRGKLSSGIVATLPDQLGQDTCLLLAVRSDRVLSSRWHGGATLVEYNGDLNSFLLPTVSTKPAIILEPLVANAICEGASQGESTDLLRTVIEKFGRKDSSLTHGEDEGLGNKGFGITPRVFELLSRHGLKQAASWLLTGRVQFDRSTNTKILPPWIPICAKQEAAINTDALLHLVSNGDQYLSEYVQSPDNNMQSNLPRLGDGTPYTCREFGLESLASGETNDALKLFDLVGTDSSECMLLQLSLMRSIASGNETELLRTLSGYDVALQAKTAGFPRAAESFAALAFSKSSGRADLKGWMKPLAPSLQRGTHFQRARQRLLGERAVDSSLGRYPSSAEHHWNTPCNESRHSWNDGPGKEKENLLLLDSIEDWLGRRQPSLIGKAGVTAAEERGDGALANILDMDKDNESEKADVDEESTAKGWDERVGEGRQDDENLSGYFRFWEGEDDEIPWRTEGFSDLSRFQCKATIVGDGGVSLSETTSGVDEGEEGKVKPTFDIVFEETGDQEPSGLAISASRGSSIDVGILHHPDRSGRQRCTLEFWYFIPSSLPSDMVLARRTFGEDADELSKVSIASDRRSMLWDLVLLRSGELEIRTCGGSVLRSTQNASSKKEENRTDIALFERWNHVCVIFSSRSAEMISKCYVSLYMMGVAVAASETLMLPVDLTTPTWNAKIDRLMEKSHLVFALHPASNFRLTEIRIWACERNETDIKSMMREYLDAAEVRKKKFRVIIGKKGKGPAKGTLLAPPKPGIEDPTVPTAELAPPKPGGLAPPKGFLSPPKGSSGGRSGLLAPPKDRQETDDSSATGADNRATEIFATGSGNDFEAAFGSFGSQVAHRPESSLQSSSKEDLGFGDASWGAPPDPVARDAPQKSLWESAIPLSQQVRSSAAAALIRGPPATRHFGGNRGGLPDLRGRDRYGVGGIAICGSEKTIVWRDEEDPPALTYPIGASGAIVSDQLDDEEGSEFLCCFLAKDKRMVVFELNSRTVVVELQMTTKLNFWRFLPPEAGENSLCFMLITPVGGFHWMPLDDSPRPRQVWKRGGDLQGKKVVQYEEGGSNGLAGSEMISKVGLICVTDSNGSGTLEAWMIPICGDSATVLVSSDVQGAAFCIPEGVDGVEFLPYLALVFEDDDTMKLSIWTILEGEAKSVSRGIEIASQPLDMHGLGSSILEPPTLAMGVFPYVLVCSLGSFIAVLMRATGSMLAYQLQNKKLSLIAKENIGYYIVDAVMRFSAIDGGIEIVMLLSDTNSNKDGRIACYNFRSQA